MENAFFNLRKQTALFLFSITCFAVCANNIQVTNVSLTGQSSTDGYTLVQFDLSWENSYRINDGIQEFWDAAWIFIKYKVGDSDKWEHATLSATGHTVSSEASLELPADRLGAFFYPKTVTNQPVNNNWQGLALRWDYRLDGLPDNAIVDVKVFGVEMVYVPSRSFWIGDGSLWMQSTFHTANAPIEQYSTDKYPYQILSEDALTLGGTDSMSIGTNNNWAMNGPYADDDFSPTVEKQLPSGFPKGYDAFYCMKYEITQAQYVEFLNSLDRAQQQANTNIDVSQNDIPDNYVMGYANGGNGNGIFARNAIACPVSGNGTEDPIIFSTTYGEIPCSMLTWEMGLAYSDWAGLRPMTELEYEKACRGIFEPVLAEIATGRAANTSRNWGIVNGTFGEENEIIFNYSLSNQMPGYPNHLSKSTIATYTSTSSNMTLKLHGPLRSGILAASNFNSTDSYTENDEITRDRAGATMYGIMEMTGNLCEPAIFVGNENHRQFVGNNGNGEIDANGTADVVDWPHTFPFYRGGSWDHGSLNSTRAVSVSDRVTSIYGGIYGQRSGWRCVRSID